jgi:cytochrome c oxidase subunit IV
MAKPKAKKQVQAVKPEKAVEAQGEAQGHHAHVGHIVDFKYLAGTFLALMFLTVVTVAVSVVDLGPLNLWVALGVAGLKASLVAVFFMHLKWDRPLNAVIFISSLLFVTLFIGFALTDTEEYQPNTIPGYAPGMPTVGASNPAPTH